MENKYTEILQGVVHEIPEDMRNRILSDETLLAKWNSLTPLARNEWICWVTAVKRAETREQHIDRLHSDLLNGKRRPCCWPGCKHR
ncbi:MAG: hypothetical protein CVT97_01555 [Bacteroidetes bacterium HGW-Bacteroidetes-14]|nr:MAG: hypothetical protein CVT97_01555 [Bacteroidetes bacterium HGW-Bacteroidetes-14]